MLLNPYQNIETSSDFQIYDFDSLGRESLRKRVRFDLIDETEQVYNLALCTILNDESEDCETASHNGDMDIVLETAAHIALIYTNRFPGRKVFFRGSNDVRSRKYQIGIARYLEAVMKDFSIEGMLINNRNEITLREPFQKGKNYSGFIFTRKN
jgi:hypothetical protein